MRDTVHMTPRLIAAAALIVAAITLASTPAHAAEPRRRLAIGDSLLASITNELQPQTPDLDIRGVPGSGLTDTANYDWDGQLANLEQSEHPDTVSVTLGTNDTIAVAQGVDYRPYITRLLDQTDAAHIYWSTCGTHSDNPGRNAACAEINSDLRAVRRPGFVVVDLDEEIYTHPAYIAADGIHFTQAGQDAAAGLYAGEINSK